MYRRETATLPKPFTGMDFVLSDDGHCSEVAGYTTGFTTPEELLAAVGLQGKTLSQTDEDDSGFRFEGENLSVVEVYKPTRVEGRYTDFLVAG